jgi:hypothetical protein
MNAFASAPFFGDRYLAYRTGETTYEQDFYNQLVAAPATLIRDEAARWLKSSPMIEAVLTPDLTAPADYMIDGKLLELSGDYRDESQPKAVVKVQFTVSDVLSGDGVTLCQKNYAVEIPMKQISPAALVQGWNQGLAKILEDFEGDLKGCLTTSKQDQNAFQGS